MVFGGKVSLWRDYSIEGALMPHPFLVYRACHLNSQHVYKPYPWPKKLPFIRNYVYMYLYVCVCVYIYIYIYIYDHNREPREVGLFGSGIPSNPAPKL